MRACPSRPAISRSLRQSRVRPDQTAARPSFAAECPERRFDFFLAGHAATLGFVVRLQFLKRRMVLAGAPAFDFLRVLCKPGLIGFRPSLRALEQFPQLLTPHWHGSSP